MHQGWHRVEGKVDITSVEISADCEVKSRGQRSKPQQCTPDIGGAVKIFEWHERSVAYDFDRMGGVVCLAPPR